MKWLGPGTQFLTMTYKQIPDPDDCASNPCAEGATCVDRSFNYTCVCPPNTSGHHCEGKYNRLFRHKQNIKKCKNYTCWLMIYGNIVSPSDAWLIIILYSPLLMNLPHTGSRPVMDLSYTSPRPVMNPHFIMISWLPITPFQTPNFHQSESLSWL